MNKPKKLKKENPLFVIAADNYRNEIMGMNKYGTYTSNKRNLTKVIAEFGHKKILEITKQDIQKFITRLSLVVGIEVIKHQIGLFKGVMEYADDDWVMPRIKMPKRTVRPKQEYYLFEDVRKLIHSAPSMERALIMLVAETGCRIGEALALQTEDILPGELSITKNVYEGVVQPTPKTISSVRQICISFMLEKELRKQISGPRKFLFRSPTDRPAWPQQLSAKMKVVCKNAGLEWKGFHAFRRGNVTELFNVVGIPERIIGYRIGHASTGTTLGVYCKTPVGCDKPWIPKIEQYLYLTNETKDDTVEE